ncbi:ATP-binding cassette domain-containing protein [Brevibacterium metallidurans]|uniref:ABC transporter domain-containing protein n=1 Tax=Brevibacterium metallidurans TaxID=1482676 RepID=A0ABN0SSM0_9MICO
MSPRPPIHVLALTVAVAAELCSLALLAVSGWYLAACALAGLGLLATFSYPTPSGIVRLLALGRIAGNYGQNVLLHRAALADTTRERLRVYDDLARGPGGAAGSSAEDDPGAASPKSTSGSPSAAGPSASAVASGAAVDAGAAVGRIPAVDDRTVDRLLTDARVSGERVLRVTAPIVVTCAAVVAAGIVAAVTMPAVTIPLLLGAAVMIVLALVPAAPDEGHGRLRAEVLASMEAAPELDSLGGTPLLRARVLDQLAELSAADRRRASRRTWRQLGAALAAGVSFGTIVVVAALASGVGTGVGDTATASGFGADLGSVPLFVMVVCLAFGVLERTFALGDIVPHLQRLRSIDAGRGDASQPAHTSAVEVDATDAGAIGITLGAGHELDVPAGTSAAIIGPSGAGKSTLLTAIARSVRQRRSLTVAHVTDDEFLFTGTVAGNLRLGAPGQRGRKTDADSASSGDDQPTAVGDALVGDAPNASVSVASPSVGTDLAEVLADLGLDDVDADTRTGINGRALSRGETRRLIIARAVLSRPDVLLIDEPDLGLDADTYVRVLGFVRDRLPDATVILAAHSAPPAVTRVLDLGGASAIR